MLLADVYTGGAANNGRMTKPQDKVQADRCEAICPAKETTDEDLLLCARTCPRKFSCAIKPNVGAGWFDVAVTALVTSMK